jgi:hypothetical protein
MLRRVTMTRTLHDRIIWAFVKTAWATAAGGLVLSVVSAHQGVAS